MTFELREVEGTNGDPIMIRTMTPHQIKEREGLNQANTAETIRQRALAAERLSNGRGASKLPSALADPDQPASNR